MSHFDSKKDRHRCVLLLNFDMGSLPNPNSSQMPFRQVHVIYT